MAVGEVKVIADGLRAGKRLASLGTAGALKFGGKYLPTETLRLAARRTFSQKLASLKGVPTKIAQMLSMGDSVDDDQGNMYQEACADIAPMPLDVVQAYLAQADLELLAKIDVWHEDCYPASLGQVHRVSLSDGQQVALKVQYPHVEDELNLDQSLMGLVSQSFSSFGKGFCLPDYQAYLQQELRAELDYHQEARYLQQFYDHFRDDKAIIIPKPCDESPKRTHLCMSWEPALSIHDFVKQADEKQRQEAASLLLEFFFRSIFDLRLIHSDPNLGNIAFRCEAGKVSLVVYDYGAIAPLPPSQAIALLKIMQCVIAGEGDVHPCYVELGFDGTRLQSLRDQLLAFSEMLFEPLVTQARYDLKQWNRKERAKEILGDHRWDFMLAAPVTFLPFMRMAQGLFYYLNELGVGLYAWPRLSSTLTRYAADLTRFCESAPASTNANGQIMAQYLKIKVMRGGQTRVALSFPRKSIENLEMIMDEALTTQLQLDGVCIADVVRRARAAGYRPMPLFDIHCNGKDVKVWLE